jgi:hypothetical protein
LQFFGLGPAKLRILKVAVPKTEVLEQPHGLKFFGSTLQFNSARMGLAPFCVFW